MTKTTISSSTDAQPGMNARWLSCYEHSAHGLSAKRQGASRCALCLWRGAIAMGNVLLDELALYSCTFACRRLEASH